MTQSNAHGNTRNGRRSQWQGGATPGWFWPGLFILDEILETIEKMGGKGLSQFAGSVIIFVLLVVPAALIYMLIQVFDWGWLQLTSSIASPILSFYFFSLIIWKLKHSPTLKELAFLGFIFAEMVSATWIFLGFANIPWDIVIPFTLFIGGISAFIGALALFTRSGKQTEEDSDDDNEGGD